VTRVILKPREETRLRAGHPWVFDNEISRVEGVEEPGAVVDVESSRKEYVGRGFLSPSSRIRVRLLSASKDGVDKGFLKRRLREALARRRPFFDLETTSARLSFAEADRLPGLIVDRYVGWPMDEVAPFLDAEGRVPDRVEVLSKLGAPRSWLSVQFLCAGMDARREAVLEALDEILAESDPLTGMAIGVPAGVVERDDVSVRELEGLERREGVIAGTLPETGALIYENELPFLADLLGGQKTGHFLDQVANRAAAARFARGVAVLDACCHTGGFAIHAARAGASSVMAVDVSAHALASVRRNAILNGVSDKVSTVEGNVFDVLRSEERAGARYGLVVLDPPAFAKSRSALEGAIRGYKEINLRGLQLLEKGGILVTCSCSYAMDEVRFKSVVAEAALDARRRLRLMESRSQAWDHPILVGYDESHYLKCDIYQVE